MDKGFAGFGVYFVTELRTTQGLDNRRFGFSGLTLSNKVLNVGLVKKFYTAGNDKGDALAREFHLQIKGLMMGAVEYGNVGEATVVLIN